MSEDHPTREDVDRWIDFWGNRFALNGWTITTVYPARDVERSYAEINWSEGYCSATLTLWPSFFKDRSRFGAFRIIAHELLHLCFAAVADELCQQIGDRIVYQSYKRQMERAIDRFAGGLAAVTPIPEVSPPPPAAGPATDASTPASCPETHDPAVPEPS